MRTNKLEWCGPRLPIIFLLIAFTGALSAQNPEALNWAQGWSNRIDAALTANEPKRADSLLTVALDSAFLRFGPKSAAEFQLLEAATTVKSYLGDLNARIALCRRAIDVANLRYGPRHRKTAWASIMLGGAIMQTQEKLDSVEVLIKGGLTVLTDLGIRQGDEFVSGYSWLGHCYRNQFRLLEAEAALREVLVQEAALHGDTTQTYGAGCNNLATCYEQMDRFADAEAYYRQSLVLTRRHFGTEHPNYALLLRNMANFYKIYGKLNQAETYAAEALSIARRVYPPGHYLLTVFLSTMADANEYLGQFDRMLPYLDEALATAERNFGPSHRQLTTTLTSLGFYYEYNGDDARAEAYFRRAAEILEASGQARTDNYSSTLANLARVQRFQGRDAEAMANLERGRDISVQLMGASHPRVFNRYTRHLVYYHLKNGQPTRAAELALPLGPTIAATYGDSSRRMTEWDIVTAPIFADLGQFDVAIDRLEHGFRNLQLEASSNLAFLSFAQKEAYIQALDRFFNEAISLGDRFPGNARACQFLYNVLLFRKTLLADTENRLLQRWRQTADPTQRSQLLDYYALRQQTIALESRPPAFQRDLPALRARVEKLEKTLTVASGSIWRESTAASSTWQDVQAALLPGDAALEFIALPGQRGAKGRYAALVLKPGAPGPAMVLLGDHAAVNQLFAGAGNRPLTYAESLYGRGVVGQHLYALLWQPLERELAGVRRVFLAPFGPLNEVNFRALPTGAGAPMLGERFDVVILTSTRRLTEPDFQRPAPPVSGTALLLGGLDYDGGISTASSVSLPAVNTAAPDRGGVSDTLPGRGGVRWTALPETRREVLAADSLLRRLGMTVQLLTGADGTETRVKAACGPGQSPAILHLATHGFFYPQPQKREGTDPRPGFLFSQNPLLRSGLVLAGANPAWTASAVPTAADDGILTAEEVSLLHLDQTALVVLSACETGLGEPRNYEGLYGLQRAFRVAGARTLIMTLWRVPDQPTRELMVDFYTRLAAGTPVRTAFHEAVRTLRQRYDAPYYWAGFVLVEG